MAWGIGTKLRPLTNDLPKPMVPIVNKPIFEHLITLLKNHNIREHDVEVQRVKDTHYSMMRAFDDKEVKIVGGTKGEFLLPDFLYATDGMFSILKILELIAKSGTSIEELDSQIPKLFMEKENISCLKEEKGKIMRRFMEDNIGYKQELIEGVKIFLNGQDTVLCMPDKNRNLVHLNIETNSEEKLRKLISKYKKKIQSYLK